MRIEAILGVPVRRDRWNDVFSIGAEQAKRILEAQPSQRPLNQRVVDAYAADMRRGGWEVTHQGLAADADGLLFDGQHRLWACFMAGLPFVTRVFFNEPRANFDMVDVGLARTPAQMAVVKGQFEAGSEANSGIAVLRFLWAYDSCKNPTLASTLPGFSSRIADAVLAEHPGVHEMLQAVIRSRLTLFSLQRGHAAALFTMFHEASADAATEFLHELHTGQNLSDGDPALTLRNSGMVVQGRSKPAARDMTYRLARAWNARWAGRKVARLYGAVSPSGERGKAGGLDLFPEVAGYTRRPISLDATMTAFRA